MKYSEKSVEDITVKCFNLSISQQRDTKEYINTLIVNENSFCSLTANIYFWVELVNLGIYSDFSRTISNSTENRYRFMHYMIYKIAEEDYYIALKIIVGLLPLPQKYITDYKYYINYKKLSVLNAYKEIININNGKVLPFTRNNTSTQLSDTENSKVISLIFTVKSWIAILNNQNASISWNNVSFSNKMKLNKVFSQLTKEIEGIEKNE